MMLVSRQPVSIVSGIRREMKFMAEWHALATG